MEEERKASPNLQTLWIVYGALCLSQLVYGVVGTVIKASGEPTTSLEMPIALVFAGITSSVLSFVMGNLIQGNYFTKCIIKWALSESVAVYGLVLCILTGNKLYLGAFIVWSLALMAVHAPSQKQFEASLKPKSDE